jgi:hypothetical protein
MSRDYARRFGFAGDNLFGSAQELPPNIATGIFTPVV